jgi:hypothetical protein
VRRKIAAIEKSPLMCPFENAALRCVHERKHCVDINGFSLGAGICKLGDKFGGQ